MSDRRTIKIHSGTDSWDQVMKSARASRRRQDAFAKEKRNTAVMKADPKTFDFDESEVKNLPEAEKWETQFTASELAPLKQHQREGISFMWFNLTKKNTGCILAHAMGLGKTCQILYLLKAFQNSNRGKRFVVVATPSLVNTWETEARKWFSDLKVFKVTSVQNATDRLDQIKGWYGTPEGAILITTYSRLSVYVSEFQKGIKTEEITSVHKMLFAGTDVMCIDEAQQIKNEASAKTMACRAFSTNLKVACTGTPMANRMDELVTLIDFVRPDTWSKKGASEFIKPIHESMKHTATASDINIAEHRAKTVVNRLAGVIHRRDQSILKAELPPISQFILRLQLSDIQAKLYQLYTKDFLARNTDKCLFEYRAMTNRIAMHPMLIFTFINRKVQEDGADPKIYEWATNLLKQDGWGWLNQDNGNVSVKQLLGCSSKLQAILTVIEESWTRGEKVLIFSSYVEILRFVRACLLQCGECGTIGIFDGETPPKERNKIVSDFQKGLLNVLLLSYGVGGVGLTLTKATKVILLETNWNWAEIQQAIFRAYRYGQTKSVTSYQLISDGTMEDKVLTVMMRKDWLHRRIIDDETPTRQHVAGDLTNYYYNYTPRKRQTWDSCPHNAGQDIDPMVQKLEDLDTILTQASEYSTLLATDPNADVVVDDDQIEKSKHHLEEFNREVSNGVGFSGLVNHSAMILQKKLAEEKKLRQKRKLEVRFAEPPPQQRQQEGTAPQRTDTQPRPKPPPPSRKIQKVDPRVTSYNSEDLSKARRLIGRHATDPEVDSVLADVGCKLHEAKRWCLTELLAKDVPPNTDTHGIIDLIFMQVLTNGASLMQNFLQMHPPNRRVFEELRSTLPQYSDWKRDASQHRDAQNWLHALHSNQLIDTSLDVHKIVQQLLHQQKGINGPDCVRDAFLHSIKGTWSVLPQWLATLIAFSLNMNVSPVQYLLQMGFRSIMDWQIANNGKIKTVLRTLVMTLTGVDPDTSNLIALASQFLGALFAPSQDASGSEASSSLEEDSVDADDVIAPPVQTFTPPPRSDDIKETAVSDSDDDIIVPTGHKNDERLDEI